MSGTTTKILRTNLFAAKMTHGLNPTQIGAILANRAPITTTQINVVIKDIPLMHL